MANRKTNIAGLTQELRVQLRLADNPNMIVDGLEAYMVNTCLFLPYIYNKEDGFGREFSIIYDDWAMCNGLGKKEIPHLCNILFQENDLDVPS